MRTVKNMHLSWDQYEAALVRFRGLIADGRPLNLDDSNEIGNKHTNCTWGLCDNTIEGWPDREDHLWPDEFDNHRRVAPKYQQDEQWCPFDRRVILSDRNATATATMRKNYDLGTWGCFYQCKFFSPLKGETPPTRDEALALYDVRIERVRARSK